MQSRQHPNSKRLYRWLLFSGIVFSVGVLLFALINGDLGVWTTSTVNAFLGTSGTLDKGLKQPISPHFTAAEIEELKIPRPVPTALPTLVPMPLVQIRPLVLPALSGEGIWITQDTAPPPFIHLPLVAKTFLRPDPLQPSAIVTLMQFDTRFIRLHMVAGTTQPGGPRGVYGPGVIPVSDQKTLLAAFNGGFMFADGQYGMQVNGTTYVPPQSGDATVAVTKMGQIILGAWGIDPRLNSRNLDLVSWRQNVFLLIDHGSINPLTQNGSLWGRTVTNQPWSYTWRSGLGITAQGTFIYAEGNALSAQTLAEALHAAGAVMAMQTDINHFWMRGFLYKRAVNGTVQITKLDPAMYGTGNEYLTSTFRDFFYLTRFTFASPSFPSSRG